MMARVGHLLDDSMVIIWRKGGRTRFSLVKIILILEISDDDQTSRQTDYLLL